MSGAACRLASLLLLPPLLLLLPLAGCGFHPLYGSADQAAEAQLPDIFVAVIPGRPGQVLRQDLQQRLAGSSEAEPQGYTLRVAYAIVPEAIGIHGDNTSARTRIIGRANWSLSSVAQVPLVLASGAARSDDGFDVVETQYFAATMAAESTESRIAGSLADSIKTQLAIWFSAHPNGTPGTAAATTTPAAPAIAPAPEFLGPQNVPGNSDQSPLQRVGPDGLPQSAIGRTTP